MTQVVRSIVPIMGCVACLSGCQSALGLNVPGLSTHPDVGRGKAAGSSSLGATSGQPQTSGASGSAPSASDADTARLILKEVFGDIATQKGDFLQKGSQGSPPGDIATVERTDWFGRQKDLLAKYQIDERARFTKCRDIATRAGLSDSNRDALCPIPQNGQQVLGLDKAVTRELVVEALSPLLPDAEVSAARARVVTTFGWDHLTTNAWQRTEVASLHERPMSQWRRFELQLADQYAKDHSVAAVTQVEAALAALPAHRCSFWPVMMYEDYQGGGVYGAPYYADKIIVRAMPDHPDWQGDIDCAQVPKATGLAAQFLKLVKTGAGSTAADSWVSVQLIASEDWGVDKNDVGYPLGKMRTVKLYQSVEP
jgi:hypothetical protein